MSITVTKKISLEKLPKLLPRAFAGMAEGLNIPEPITLLVFDNDPIHSRTLDRELKRLEAKQASVICVARDFTVEARALAAERQVHLLSVTCFGWSDESHEDLKASIGAKVKRPN